MKSTPIKVHYLKENNNTNDIISQRVQKSVSVFFRTKQNFTLRHRVTAMTSFYSEKDSF